MKRYLFLLALACVLFACNSHQKDAKNLSDNIQATMKEHVPGTLTTKEDGWTMKAKINGKDWVADAMMPTEGTDRILGYYGKEYISFPYSGRDMVVGKKIRISENWAVDFVNDDDGICGGTKGEMNITKVDDNWAEGTFFFTVTSCLNNPNKKIEVTDGFFRIGLKHAP
ncbi:MAG: hypothetical protein JWR38_809 [Mucilaginibacter sp.]|nr:hypothetical protein [Mucilaginibacter sp.]